nr:major head protein [Microvirus sp.]
MPLNRNVESHFAQLPTAQIQRSILDMSFSHKTSLNAGRLIPFMVKEILPGDTDKIAVSKVLRMQTPVAPIMDDLYCDTYFFFVPNRLTWEHWEEFCGENKTGAWAPTKEYSIPRISSPVEKNASGANVRVPFATGTLADYMGLPVAQTLADGTVISPRWMSSDDVAPMSLPFRAYGLICNHFFRDENLSDPLLVPIDDANQTGSNGDDEKTDVCNGGMPYKVSKYHDYFTSCLPSAQKGPAIGVPISGSAPVMTSGLIPGAVIKGNDNFYPGIDFSAGKTDGAFYPMVWAADKRSQPGQYWQFDDSKDGLTLEHQSADVYKALGKAASGYLMHRLYGTQADGVGGSINVTGATDGAQFTGAPVNLRAFMDGRSADVSFPINQFRIAYAYQEFLEALARGGSRYGEMINTIFGVLNPDSRLQEPEYLGGNRIPIVINEVLNTAQTSSDSLGDTGAQSATADVSELFTKSFTEHGFLIGLMCIRYNHTYGQGIDRFWTRQKFTDFYNPKFANLGEMPVYKYQLFADASTMTKDSETDMPPIFGYQEAWAEYRYSVDRVSGEMRPGVKNSLAFWHLADFYKSPPTLSDSWIREDGKVVDRVLSVSSDVSNQFFCDIYVQDIATRCMPMYSIPGLVPRF